ncbi:MAG: MFS transporter, partial [archaeon]|nr:MFS transporter [archaeon]
MEEAHLRGGEMPSLDDELYGGDTPGDDPLFGEGGGPASELEEFCPAEALVAATGSSKEGRVRAALGKVSAWCSAPVAAMVRALRRRHPGFNYGWAITLLTGLTTLCNVGGATFTMGFFMKDFMETLDVSRSALSLAWAVAMLGTALCGPLVGRAIDLLGPKLVMAVSTVFFVADLLWISKLSSLYEIFVMFFLARMGTTSLAAAAQNANSQWWVKYRARQMALANALGSVSFVYPSLLLLLREEFGWRGSWLVQGVVVLVIFSVIVFFLLDRPELFDLLPDGAGGNGYGEQISVEMGDMTALVDTVQFQLETEPREGEPKETETETREELTNDPLEVTIEGGPLEEIHWRWQDALRTAWFWVFCTGIFLAYSFWSGFNFHFREIAVDRGFSPEDTSWVFPLVTISALVVCLTTGFSMDKLRNKSLTIVAGLLLCCF